MYDIVIIGAGWAGFNAALKAKELGLKTCLVEAEQIGGTCLNHGCIPTKTLIHSINLYEQISKSPEFGIEACEKAVLNLKQAQEYKKKTVAGLRKGMESMLKGIDFINDGCELASPGKVRIGPKLIDAKNILLATGSRPMQLKGFSFDGKKVLSSDQMLEIDKAPGSILIIGAGVIGCEFAGILRSLGSKVTLLEAQERILPQEDREISLKLEAELKKKGIEVRTGATATPQDALDYDATLVCIGRVPFTSGAEKSGVKLEKGAIVVDEELKTSIPGIYAAGDCTNQCMLAHFAAFQGKEAARSISGGREKNRKHTVPVCVYTDPQVSRAGLTETEAVKKGFKIKTHKAFFLGNPIARINSKTSGFLKIIAEEQSDDILGVSIIGDCASELIATATLAIDSGCKLKGLKDTIFAHPSLSEIYSA